MKKLFTTYSQHILGKLLDINFLASFSFKLTPKGLLHPSHYTTGLNFSKNTIENLAKNMQRSLKQGLCFLAFQWTNGNYANLAASSIISKTNFCQGQSVHVNNISFIDVPVQIVYITIANSSTHFAAVGDATLAA